MTMNQWLKNCIYTVLGLITLFSLYQSELILNNEYCLMCQLCLFSQCLYRILL